MELSKKINRIKYLVNSGDYDYGVAKDALDKILENISTADSMYNEVSSIRNKLLTNMYNTQSGREMGGELQNKYNSEIKAIFSQNRDFTYDDFTLIEKLFSENYELYGLIQTEAVNLFFNKLKNYLDFKNINRVDSLIQLFLGKQEVFSDVHPDTRTEWIDNYFIFVENLHTKNTESNTNIINSIGSFLSGIFKYLDGKEDYDGRVIDYIKSFFDEYEEKINQELNEWQVDSAEELYREWNNIWRNFRCIKDREELNRRLPKVNDKIEGRNSIINELENLEKNNEHYKTIENWDDTYECNSMVSGIYNKINSLCLSVEDLPKFLQDRLVTIKAKTDDALKLFIEGEVIPCYELSEFSDIYCELIDAKIDESILNIDWFHDGVQSHFSELKKNINNMTDQDEVSHYYSDIMFDLDNYTLPQILKSIVIDEYDKVSQISKHWEKSSAGENLGIIGDSIDHIVPNILRELIDTNNHVWDELNKIQEALGNVDDLDDQMHLEKLKSIITNSLGKQTIVDKAEELELDILRVFKKRKIDYALLSNNFDDFFLEIKDIDSDKLGVEFKIYEDISLREDILRNIILLSKRDIKDDVLNVFNTIAEYHQLLSDFGFYFYPWPDAIKDIINDHEQLLFKQYNNLLDYELDKKHNGERLNNLLKIIDSDQDPDAKEFRRSEIFSTNLKYSYYIAEADKDWNKVDQIIKDLEFDKVENHSLLKKIKIRSYLLQLLSAGDIGKFLDELDYNLLNPALQEPYAGYETKNLLSHLFCKSIDSLYENISSSLIDNEIIVKLSKLYKNWPPKEADQCVNNHGEWLNIESQIFSSSDLQVDLRNIVRNINNIVSSTTEDNSINEQFRPALKGLLPRLLNNDERTILRVWLYHAFRNITPPVFDKTDDPLDALKTKTAASLVKIKNNLIGAKDWKLIEELVNKINYLETDWLTLKQLFKIRPPTESIFNDIESTLKRVKKEKQTFHNLYRDRESIRKLELRDFRTSRRTLDSIRNNLLNSPNEVKIVKHMIGQIEKMYKIQETNHDVATIKRNFKNYGLGADYKNFFTDALIILPKLISLFEATCFRDKEVWKAVSRELSSNLMDNANIDKHNDFLSTDSNLQKLYDFVVELEKRAKRIRSAVDKTQQYLMANRDIDKMHGLASLEPFKASFFKILPMDDPITNYEKILIDGLKNTGAAKLLFDEFYELSQNDANFKVTYWLDGNKTPDWMFE